MNTDWKQDPKVKGLNPEKVQFLSNLVAQLETLPKNQIPTKFLSLTLEANQRGISFSDQETNLMVGILSNYMNPADRGKLDTLRMLSRKLAAKK
ncbi:MAG: hypothetical protein RSF83_10730 [Hungatella sp.]